MSGDRTGEAKATLPAPMLGCYSSDCPKCGAKSPCVDHNSVDIGIGFQTFDHEFWCPTHGGFAHVDNEFGNPMAGTKTLFRDDEEAKGSGGETR